MDLKILEFHMDAAVPKTALPELLGCAKGTMGSWRSANSGLDFPDHRHFTCGHSDQFCTFAQAASPGAGLVPMAK